jgi:bifunctional DNA-binding transcriptional regulator/antitoxin component of YhaV-PrlF toxin-antitoxin module
MIANAGQVACLTLVLPLMKGENIMTAIVFSTKGQVVIPKAMRDAHGFAPGVSVEAVNLPEGVLLKAVPARKKRPVSELFGMLKDYYNGPPISDAEINAASAQGAIDRYERSKRDCS